MNHYCATFLCLLLVALILPACQTLEAPVIPTDTGEGEGEGEGETDSTTSTDSSTADTDSHNGTDTGTNTGDDCGTDSADCDHNGVPDDKAWVHLVVQCTGCDNVSSVVLYGKNGDAFNGPPNYYHLYSNPPWPMDMILKQADVMGSAVDIDWPLSQMTFAAHQDLGGNNSQLPGPEDWDALPVCITTVKNELTELVLTLLPPPIDSDTGPDTDP